MCRTKKRKDDTDKREMGRAISGTEGSPPKGGTLVSLRNVLVASTWSRGIRCDMPCAGLYPVLYCTGRRACLWVCPAEPPESHHSEPLENWRVTGEPQHTYALRRLYAAAYLCMPPHMYHVIMHVLLS